MLAEAGRRRHRASGCARRRTRPRPRSRSAATGRTSSLRESSRSVSVTSWRSRSPIAAIGARPEHLPDDGGVGQQRLRVRRQRVQPRGDQRLHGVGERHLRALAQLPARPRCDEQVPVLRAAARTPRRTAGCRRRGPGSAAAARRGSRSRRAARRRDAPSLPPTAAPRLIECRVAQPRGVVGVALEQLGPRGADDQQRHALGAIGEVLQECEHRVVRPVQVLEHQHRRVAASAMCSRNRRQAVNSSSRSAEEDASIPSSGRSRWRNQARSSPSGSTASSFAVAVAGSSDSRMPAWALTISPSAQNVIPSPYGRHRPCRQVTSSGRSSM